MDDHDHMTDSHGASPAVAFAITVGAGAATWVGAAVVLIPALVKKASPRVFAFALGISAGFLAYVSTIKIFSESFESFVSSGLAEGRAYTYTTICFMGGAVSLKVIDILVSITFHLKNKTTKASSMPLRHQETGTTDEEANIARDERIDVTGDTVIPYCPGCVDDPLSELNEIIRIAENKTRDGSESTLDDDFIEMSPDNHNNNIVLRLPCDDEHKHHHQKNEHSHLNDPHAQQVQYNTDGHSDENFKKVSVEFIRTDDRNKLMRTGLSIGLAITLHNFPEGFATFFAALDDARVGAVLAAGIALHNLPMGICISFPVYYSTGKRWKGFLSGFALGLTQPLAALFGWLMINNTVTDDKLGVLFGIAGGLMIMIALKELLPAAHKYDPKDSVVTYSLLGGMGIMALALALLEQSHAH